MRQSVSICSHILQGAITMENLMVRYRPELPPVIHSLSFATRAREKACSYLSCPFS